MFKPEKFSPHSSQHPETGESLNDEFERADSRRGILFGFLEHAAKSPNILRDGLDTIELNRLIAETGGDVEFVPPRPGETSRLSDTFMARFHPDIKYAPLAAIESAPDEALTPEMRELRSFMPFLRDFLEKIALNYGIKPVMPDGHAVVIGFGKREPGAKLLGGYHASLNEQGYKILDATLQENLRLDGTERPEYRIVDILRSVAHDVTHAVEYKRVGRLSSKLRRLELKLESEQDPDVRLDLANDIEFVREMMKDSDIDIQQYGLAMIGRDHAVEIDGEVAKFSLGASLFEYATDDIARGAVMAYLRQTGHDLPEPASGLETLMRKDLQGDCINESDLLILEPQERETGEYMVEYGKNILRPAQEILRLMGPLREKFVEAMRESVFTGKYRKIKAIKEDLGSLPPENVEILREYAKNGAVFLRPLFAGEKE